MEHLVLWDIDRTLINAGGGGKAIFLSAYREVVGAEPPSLPDFGGRTDHYIFTTALTGHGRGVDDRLTALFLDTLAAHTEAAREQIRANGVALAGAAAAVAALAEVPGVVQTVVTGNIRDAARIKLAAFDLLGPMDLDIGGYGGEHPVRSVLVRLARDRAERKHGVALPDHRVVVIGDTEHDVEGALHNGVTAIAVATGGATVAQLHAAGAHTVLESLADTAALLRAIGVA
ncbi:haloacid dehalogenase-like hydrolase [Catellatospora sp. KI3]|uniref:HAD family hydrolase n=1 Tax=Catellatospora sp. KI3 TaxID=3041620 RepID=UPI002482CB5C|nr:haloacid dehalogenase-like hydrolase [Catellatospora sp. KI3]MDI1463813.1 haloacid dehalogenase-like hydrolase [Catellatospora sp. KI3]